MKKFSRGNFIFFIVSLAGFWLTYNTLNTGEIWIRSGTVIYSANPLLYNFLLICMILGTFLLLVLALLFDFSKNKESENNKEEK